MAMTVIGNGSFVNADRIVALAGPDSMPVRRLIQDAKENGRLIDVSCGKKTACVIVTDNGYVILSAEATKTIRERIMKDE